MQLTITHSTRGSHRDTEYLATARLVDNHRIHVFYIDNKWMIVAKLPDHKWWIIPNFTEDEYLVSDIGPYDTAEEATAMLRLFSTSSQMMEL